MTATRLPLVLSLLLSLPLAAAGRPLGEQQLARTAYGAYGPTTAFAGDRFLTVWSENMGEIGRHVKGAFSDAAGRRVSPAAFTLLRDVNPSWAQLVGTGDAYVLFWQHNGWRMSEIDLQGRVISTRSLDLPRFSVDHADVGWNGSRFLVAMERGNYPRQDAEAFLLERNGDLVSREIPINYLSSTYEVLPVAGGFVLFSAGANLYAHRITNDGVVDRTLIEAGTGTTQGAFRPPSVAAVNLGNDTVLAVWTSDHVSNKSQLRSALLTSNGAVSSPYAIVTEDGLLTPVGLLRSGGGAVLAYTHVVHPGDSGLALFTVPLDTRGAVAGSRTEGPDLLDADVASSDSTMLIVGNVDGWAHRSVSGIAVASGGVIGAPEILSISPAAQSQPVLAAGGGRLLASWTDFEAPAAWLRTAVLTPDAEPIHRTTVAGGFLATRDLAWNGTEYLAVIHANDKLMALRIDANGEAIGQPAFMTTTHHIATWTRPVSVAWVGDRWLVVWTRLDNFWMTQVSRTGVVTEPRTLALTPALPSNWERRAGVAAIAFDGSDVLLVWNERWRERCDFGDIIITPYCPEDQLAFAARLSTDGDVLDAQPLALPSLTTATSLAIATSGREFVVVGGNRAVSIDARGATPRLIAARELFGSLSDVTWDGRDYVVALRYRLIRYHLALRRLDANLNETAPARGLETLPASTLHAPSVAAADTSGAVVGIQEGDADSGDRAIVYPENELPLLVRPPAPPQNVRIRSVGPNQYEISWDPPPGDVELYQVQRRSGDGWQGFGVLPADYRAWTTSDPQMRVRAINAGGYSEFALPPSRARAVRH